MASHGTPIANTISEPARNAGSAVTALRSDSWRSAYHSSSRTRRAVAEPLEGSIETRSAASGRNEGSEV